MMVPLTLGQMILDLRAEAGHSLNAAHGANTLETHKYLLRRTQRELFAAHDWPDKMIYETLAFSAGDPLLTDPAATSHEQINQLWVLDGTRYRELHYGVRPEDYNVFGRDGEAFPPRRWRRDAVSGKIELWPVPSRDGECLALGQKRLGALVADGDYSTLDGQLIVMFAASDLLSKQKDEGAGLRLQKAQAYLRNLLRNAGSNKRGPILTVPSSGAPPKPTFGIPPLAGA